MSNYPNTLGAAQPKEMSEIESAMERLHGNLNGLRSARSDLRDRLDTALRPAIPTATGGSPSVTGVSPTRSAIGVRIHEISDGLNAEIESIRDMINRLAV